MKISRITILIVEVKGKLQLSLLSMHVFLCRVDNAGLLRVSGQQDVFGSSGPPDRYLNLYTDERFVLYLGTVPVHFEQI